MLGSFKNQVQTKRDTQIIVWITALCSSNQAGTQTTNILDTSDMENSLNNLKDMKFITRYYDVQQ